ncbi:hypothetical protein MRX96_053282 [Rhipicephalus microplus]
MMRRRRPTYRYAHDEAVASWCGRSRRQGLRWLRQETTSECGPLDVRGTAAAAADTTAFATADDVTTGESQTRQQSVVDFRRLRCWLDA